MEFMTYFTEQIGAQGIWFALFLYLFVKQDKKNVERETKLEEQLDKSNLQLSASIDALKDLKEVRQALKEISNQLTTKKEV